MGLGRTKPYTAIGISRVPCVRCGQPSTQQWSICSLGNRHCGICTACDIQLQSLVLNFMRVPYKKRLLRKYIRELMTQEGGLSRGVARGVVRLVAAEDK